MDVRGQGEEIVEAIAMAGIEDLAGKFLPQLRAWCKDQRTWEMARQGRAVRYRTDYTLGSNRWIFQNGDVWDLRHNSDHLMVIGRLYSASLMEHSRYLGRRMRITLQPPVRQTRTRAEKIFADLRRAALKPDKQAMRQNLWILAEIWRIVDERVSMRREPGRDQRKLRRLV